MNLLEIEIRLIGSGEEPQFKNLMHLHHYLGAPHKIGENLWYAALWQGHWVACLSFSTAAWKCAARDQWIGWDFRHQYDRLKLLTNNSRFLILPDFHFPNLGSRVLSLCQKRLQGDWQENFGHPVLLLETFVDPQRFYGTVYKAANWLYVGDTKGFRRSGQGYSLSKKSPKMVFVKPLRTDARALLSKPILEPLFQTGEPKIMLKAEQMQSLYDAFKKIPDPRRAQGVRHQLPTVLAISAGAVLCGMHGYNAIAEWAKSLGQKARARFRCRRENGKRVVPSEYVIRDILIRIDPGHLDQALKQWNEVYGEKDESLAIDGKTMCNAIDEEGRQTHIMSVVGHESAACYTQKKSVLCR